MDNFWEIAVPVLALFGSIALAAALLTRQRAKLRPEHEDPAVPEIPTAASRRQRKVLEQLEPAPEIPTLMDMVRTEIQELGIEEIPGHEGLPGPVLLRVFRRDQAVRESCPHGRFEFRLAADVDPAEAMEKDVELYCPACDATGTNQDD